MVIMNARGNALQCQELEKRAESLRQQGQARVSELEKRLEEQQPQTDTTGEVTHAHTHTHYTRNDHTSSFITVPGVCVQVKRVMNGVFQSLRGEFELNETYTGSVVLGVLVNTIKVSKWQVTTAGEENTYSREYGKSKRKGKACST